ncbi:sirohydrochlorin chelatase [Streptomyces sp. NPDC051907]|uniref:sirohydrochlorin chelatase n=1 Tax=Streptomyces sp. NPDC051907 TaxID=3155284 RepID=UPI00341C0E3B
MTEPVHPRESPPLDDTPLDAPPFDDTSLDSTAQLLSRITVQLGAQLSHVTRNGTPRRMTHTDQPTLVAVAHGSRDPRALVTVTALLDLVRELRPGLDVRLGHIELNEPLLPDTLAALGPAGNAVLVPLMLGRGYHVKHDLPQAAEASPCAQTRVAAPLGPHPLLVEALCSRLAEAGWRDEDSGSRGAAVVLAAAGSRDPESAADARRTAEMLSERLEGTPVLAAFASGAVPAVPAAVRALAARGRHRIAVASYFASPGLFASRSAAAAPWTAADPIGAHPALARLVLHRYDQAVAAARPLGAGAAAGARSTSYPAEHAAQRRELAPA